MLLIIKINLKQPKLEKVMETIPLAERNLSKTFIKAIKYYYRISIPKGKDICYQIHQFVALVIKKFINTLSALVRMLIWQSI